MSEQGSIARSAVEQQRENWVQVGKTLQTKLDEVMTESARLQQQLQQISGAIQACDVLLRESPSTNDSDVIVDETD